MVGVPGKGDDEVLLGEISEESQEFGDILQENFIDSYLNLTVKSMMMLKWFNSFYDEEKQLPAYLLKADDDNYINLQRLGEVEKENPESDLLMGQVNWEKINGKNIKRVIRDPFSPVYCPEHMFSGNTFPDYLDGGAAYLMTSEVAR